MAVSLIRRIFTISLLYKTAQEGTSKKMQGHPLHVLERDTPLYTADLDLSIPTSLDSSLETTAHQPDARAQDGSGDTIYRHAYL